MNTPKVLAGKIIRGVYCRFPKLRVEGYYRIVLTNGCFDVIHRGHAEYLAMAASLGDILVVALNSDKSVAQLKGPTRPINTEWDRAIVLASMQAVGVVLIFDGDMPSVIRGVRPTVWCKASDYSLETLNPAEVAAAREVGAEIKLIPMTEGYSTTKIIQRLQGDSP